MSIQPEEVTLGLTQHDLVTGDESAGDGASGRGRFGRSGRWYEFRLGARVGLVVLLLGLAAVAWWSTAESSASQLTSGLVGSALISRKGSIDHCEL